MQCEKIASSSSNMVGTWWTVWVGGVCKGMNRNLRHQRPHFFARLKSRQVKWVIIVIANKQLQDHSATQGTETTQNYYTSTGPDCKKIQYNHLQNKTRKQF